MELLNIVKLVWELKLKIFISFILSDSSAAIFHPSLLHYGLVIGKKLILAVYPVGKKRLFQRFTNLSKDIRNVCFKLGITFMVIYYGH